MDVLRDVELSVCQPIAVRTPRSAPLPALWPGTWKRVEPRNPYATTASRYGAVGWSVGTTSPGPMVTGA